jgi:fructokinase
MGQQIRIVGLGEALWDRLPTGKVLGGAPLNVACHAHRLLRDVGGHAVVASRIGTDPLGDELVRQLAERGMETDFLQRDVKHATGTVDVSLAAGQPTYAFAADIAWDHLEFTPAWAELAQRCDAVCFGTLAQRSPKSRSAIWAFLDAAPQALRVFDVNLRQLFYDRQSVLESCRRATHVKLNDQELDKVAQMLDLPAGTQTYRLARMRDQLNLAAVVLTRGALGTLLVHRNGVEDPPPMRYPAVANADAVGAGDACAAAILVGSILAWEPARTAALANELGAFVASRPGATPELPPALIRAVQQPASNRQE